MECQCVECGVLQLMEWGRGGDMIENNTITRCNGPKPNV